MAFRQLFAVVLVAAACKSANTKAEGATPSAESAVQACTSSAPAAPGIELDPKLGVARAKGRQITAGELDAQAKAELKRAEVEYREKVYQIRRQTIESMVIKPIMEEKAKAKGMKPEQFAESEIKSRVAEPSDKEVQALYDNAKAGGAQLPPLDQVRPQIVNHLKQQQMQATALKYFADLKKEAQLEISIPMPRVTVSTEGPSKGPATAPVTIVEFSDFECPYCSRAEKVVAEVLEKYKDKVRLVYRDFPLPMHQHAQKASEAAFCAQDQGKYWDMHSKLFANQKALDVPALKAYAKELKLDTAKFDKCLDSGAKANEVANAKKAGDEAGVSSTPIFFINGVVLSGAQPVEEFQNVIDAELAKK